MAEKGEFGGPSFGGPSGGMDGRSALDRAIDAIISSFSNFGTLGLDPKQMKSHLDFSSTMNLPYNAPYSQRQLNAALKAQDYMERSPYDYGQGGLIGALNAAVPAMGAIGYQAGTGLYDAGKALMSGNLSGAKQAMGAAIPDIKGNVQGVLSYTNPGMGIGMDLQSRGMPESTRGFGGGGGI